MSPRVIVHLVCLFRLDLVQARVLCSVLDVINACASHVMQSSRRELACAKTVKLRLSLLEPKRYSRSLRG